MFIPTADQEELRQTVRRFFDATSPEAVVRATMASLLGYDSALWRRMAQELGLLGMAVPEELGGSGFTFAESCIVLEEAGRAMVCAPLLSTLGLAVNVLLCAGDEQLRKQLLPELVAGDKTVAVALPASTSHLNVEETPTAQVLSGECAGVLDAVGADVLLLALGEVGNYRLFEVDTTDPGVARRGLKTLDLTRRSSTVTLDRATARLVANMPDSQFERIRNLATVALAAEQVGGAQRALDASVDYAKLRVQFGRTIGSFQAVKHRLADMLVAVETARSAYFEAVGAAVSGTEQELAVAASVAGAYCSEVYATVAEDAIQIHGGVGFTWEHPAHLWFRRAKADAVLFGAPSVHRARLAQLIP